MWADLGKPGMSRRMSNHFNNHFCCFGHNIAKLVLLSYGEINLSSILYYVYRRRYGRTSLQKADIFERSWPAHPCDGAVEMGARQKEWQRSHFLRTNSQALNRTSDAENDQLQHKFDIAYFMAIEKISFRQYPQFCELEARHRVAIGSVYTNEIACKSFTHFIAESQRRRLLEKLAQAKFFSLLIDGSTDKGNAEELAPRPWAKSWNKPWVPVNN